MWRIIVRGIVEGVGFRPYVYTLAKSLGLGGFVRNNGSYVEIVVNRDVKGFIDCMMRQLPAGAKIESVEVQEYAYDGFNDFYILTSGNKGSSGISIPCDTAICDECLAELFDADGRRYLYPFISCTTCGQRFSILEKIPFDRENTSLKDFPICEACENEYRDPRDRRFHAQTISCPRCGPTYHLYDENRSLIDESCIDAIREFSKAIDDGSIGIAKSWGGMHLLCNLDRTKRLREIFRRPQKPFAVMFRNIEVLNEFVDISGMERDTLLEKGRPIVLLEKGDSYFEEISPKLPNIGVYLPYSALHHLLFNFMKEDLIIVTSANVPGEPMITVNEEAFLLKADLYLLHNLKIVNRVDDSVLRIDEGGKFFLRRSRGYIPFGIHIPHQRNVISFGPEENVTGGISKEGIYYPTQYIGDVKYYKTLRYLEESIEKLISYIGIKREELDAIAFDLHPSFISKRYFREKFSPYEEVFEIQHHWAHASSLMVDDDLDEMVCLAVDGAGYGDDGNIWGCEVLYTTFEEFRRLGTITEFPLIGGDRATKEPIRILFAFYETLKDEVEEKDSIFEGIREADVWRRVMKRSPKTTSMGRVLDSLSCHKKICCNATYDGEPAMKFERYLNLKQMRERNCKMEDFDPEILTEDGIKKVDIYALYRDLFNKDIDEYTFLSCLIKSLSTICVEESQNLGVEYIGLTGGVSYNKVISEIFKGCVNAIDPTVHVVFHNSIPNGDGGVAVGQNAIAGRMLEVR